MFLLMTLGNINFNFSGFPEIINSQNSVLRELCLMSQTSLKSTKNCYFTIKFPTFTKYPCIPQIMKTEANRNGCLRDLKMPQTVILSSR